MGFPGGLEGKVSACNAGDPGLIPGSGRSPGEGNGNPPQYSCLENRMDGGAHQARLSLEFSRQEDWGGLPFPSPGGLPNPGIEPVSPALQADSLPSEPPGKALISGLFLLLC